MNLPTATKRCLLVLVAVAGLAACNPLLTDPESIGGEQDETAVAYRGPSNRWLAVAVDGAPDHRVYALALVLDRDRTGPSERRCAGPVRPCVVTTSDVRMPDQRLVPGDGSRVVRLMTVWSGETAQLVLVCVDPDTQELGCPAALRAEVRVVDGDGALVGDLEPGRVGP
jgi:hypothetical protein